MTVELLWKSRITIVAFAFHFMRDNDKILWKTYFVQHGVGKQKEET